MIESTAYFEAYNHVLTKIKGMDQWSSIPFMNEIAKSQHSSIACPPYLKDAPLETMLKIDDEIVKSGLDSSQTKSLDGCFKKNIQII